MIELVSSKTDAAGNWRVERVPNEIVQFDRQPRRPPIAWRRNLDVLAGVKHDGTEHPADRLRETRSGVLGRGICLRISAVPRWRAAQLVGGQPVDRPGRERAR